MNRNVLNPKVPEHPSLVQFRHPCIDEIFLLLPANNVLPTTSGGTSTHPTFGVHQGTALSACEVLATAPGFLSTSIDRTQSGGQAPQDLDQLLTEKKYYYHVFDPTTPLYPICLDFRSWTFPHNQLPKQWAQMHHTPADEPIGDGNWTIISARVKQRDNNSCLVSGWCDSIMTAHVIPKEEAIWVSSYPTSLDSISTKY
jgi:hypothetical protein